MGHHEIREYYASGVEKNRLDQNYFKLEGIRTKEIISRYLNGPGLNILVVGGGAGYYLAVSCPGMQQFKGTGILNRSANQYGWL